MIKKKQHWLPCAYLNFFAIPDSGNGRKAKIHRVSNSGIHSREIEEEGYSNWHYRTKEENPNQSEGLFEIGEATYPLLIEKFLMGQILSKEEKINILHFLILLHIRNPSYLNETDISNFDKVQNIFAVLMEIMVDDWEILPESEDFDLSIMPEKVKKRFDETGLELSKSDIWTAIVRNQILCDIWELNFLKVLDGNLWTIDHPVILLGIEPNVDVILAPISPQFLAVAVDTRKYQIRNQWLTSHDEKTIVRLLASQTQRFIYSSEADKSKLSNLTNLLKNKSSSWQSIVSEEGWIPQILQINKLRELGLTFDFLLELV